MTVSVSDYGAIGDGKLLETKAIQAAIDDVAAKGGGCVNVPAGIYLTGTIWLRDNIELHLEPGATLLGSTNMDDYNALDAYPQNYSWLPEKWVGKHLILAVNCQNVSITGTGTIDGNSGFFLEPPENPPKLRRSYGWNLGLRTSRDLSIMRPGQTIVFCECDKVLVNGIRIMNSSCWSCFIYGCNDVVVENVFIKNPPDSVNSDGIDIDCSRNVMVSNCNIDTGDDAITLRGSSRHLKEDKPCENVTVTNCVLACSVCGFRIGVGNGCIRNASISNIVIHRAGTGFLIQSCYSSGRGVDISNINVSNIRIVNTGYPVRVVTGQPEAIGLIKNIFFNGFYGECFADIKVQGNDNAQPDNISFKNFDLHVVKSPYCLAEKECYPARFLTIEKAGNVIFKDFHAYYDEDALPFWQDGALDALPINY